jgi:hypothetical protein
VAAEEVSNHSGSLREAKADFEKSYIVQKLDENDWNVTKRRKPSASRGATSTENPFYGLDPKKGR